MTAFLHLVALRDHHRAETQGERREKHLSALEGDAQPLNPPSRAEVLGTYQKFSRLGDGPHLLINPSFHFCTGFASRQHRRDFACLFIGKEEIPVVIHGGIVKYRD